MSRIALYTAGLVVVGAIVAVVALNKDEPDLLPTAGQTAAPRNPNVPVFESSVGGVVEASKLPGQQGQGYLVFSKWCSGCHAPEWKPKNGDARETAKLSPPQRLALGTNILQQRYKGSVPAALEERTDLTPDTVRYFVRNGINAMPAFRKTEITDADLDALAAYLSRNNQTSGNGK